MVIAFSSSRLISLVLLSYSMKVDLDGAQISALLSALDTERKSLVRAQAQKGKVQGLAEVYGHVSDSEIVNCLRWGGFN